LSAVDKESSVSLQVPAIRRMV